MLVSVCLSNSLILTQNGNVDFVCLFFPLHPLDKEEELRDTDFDHTSDEDEEQEEYYQDAQGQEAFYEDEEEQEYEDYNSDKENHRPRSYLPTPRQLKENRNWPQVVREGNRLSCNKKKTKKRRKTVTKPTVESDQEPPPPDRHVKQVRKQKQQSRKQYSLSMGGPNTRRGGRPSAQARKPSAKKTGTPPKRQNPAARLAQREKARQAGKRKKDQEEDPEEEQSEYEDGENDGYESTESGDNTKTPVTKKAKKDASRNNVSPEDADPEAQDGDSGSKANDSGSKAKGESVAELKLRLAEADKKDKKLKMKLAEAKAQLALNGKARKNKKLPSANSPGDLTIAEKHVVKTTKTQSWQRVKLVKNGQYLEKVTKMTMRKAAPREFEGLSGEELVNAQVIWAQSGGGNENLVRIGSGNWWIVGDAENWDVDSNSFLSFPVLLCSLSRSEPL